MIELIKDWRIKLEEKFCGSVFCQADEPNPDFYTEDCENCPIKALTSTSTNDVKNILSMIIEKGDGKNGR